MDYAEHVEATDREIAALVDALGAGPLDVPVPTCPDWTLVDLADHVGGFCGFWAHILCDATGRPKTSFAERPAGTDGPEAADWLGGLGDDLLTLLRSTEPTQQAWTWAPGRDNAAFVARRSAHELSVHRFDAQGARGPASPIDGALAIDGIEEIFVMREAWVGSGQGDVAAGAGETIHLHATDREAEWLIELTADGLVVRREHAKGDLALRGAVSDLELVLYDRPPLGSIERFGDESVLGAWYQAFHFG
jgi:uncharacterized protein (TIGR03083 family)